MMKSIYTANFIRAIAILNINPNSMVLKMWSADSETLSRPLWGQNHSHNTTKTFLILSL